jgi:hypothetical protein
MLTIIETNAEHTRAKTERLRAQRLAKEAGAEAPDKEPGAR